MIELGCKSNFYLPLNMERLKCLFICLIKNEDIKVLSGAVVFKLQCAPESLEILLKQIPGSQPETPIW